MMIKETEEQLLVLIEPTEQEEVIIKNYIKDKGVIRLMEEFNDIELSNDTKEKIEALKIILSASSD